MTTYISLLCGINVSGHNMIKMADLKSLYEEHGFTNIKTYLQSGNVVFDARQTGCKEMEESISAMIKKSMALNISVIVLTVQELKDIILNNPFPQALQNLYVTFLATPPAPFDQSLITDKALPGEEMVFTPRAIYFNYAQGYGKTKIHNNFIESKLKVIATTRNWKTTNEILRMATT